jgi:hypothetical protein
MRRAQARECRARLLEAAALHARLLREELDQLLVLALQRGELLELACAKPSRLCRRARVSLQEPARFRAHGGRVVDAPLVHHAARERLLER